MNFAIFEIPEGATSFASITAFAKVDVVQTNSLEEVFVS